MRRSMRESVAPGRGGGHPDEGGTGHPRKRRPRTGAWTVSSGQRRAAPSGLNGRCRPCAVLERPLCVRRSARAKARAGRPRRFAEAVGAAHRLPCGARSRGPSLNSLRSLRSLRSNRRDESVVEARCARGHEPCAPRRLTGAPQPARTRLCSHRRGVGSEHQPPWTSRQGLPAGRDLGGDEQRRAGVGACAARASWADSPRLFERRERSERSELSGATPDRAAQCSRCAAPTATA